MINEAMIMDIARIKASARASVLAGVELSQQEAASIGRRRSMAAQAIAAFFWVDTQSLEFGVLHPLDALTFYSIAMESRLSDYPGLWSQCSLWMKNLKSCAEEVDWN
jgi:hypothetical protein